MAVPYGTGMVQLISHAARCHDHSPWHRVPLLGDLILNLSLVTNIRMGFLCKSFPSTSNQIWLRMQDWQFLQINFSFPCTKVRSALQTAFRTHTTRNCSFAAHRQRVTIPCQDFSMDMFFGTFLPWLDSVLQDITSKSSSFHQRLSRRFYSICTFDRRIFWSNRRPARQRILGMSRSG
jgi:hypothetical protein